MLHVAYAPQRIEQVMDGGVCRGNYVNRFLIY